MEEGLADDPCPRRGVRNCRGRVGDQGLLRAAPLQSRTADAVRHVGRRALALHVPLGPCTRCSRSRSRSSSRCCSSRIGPRCRGCGGARCPCSVRCSSRVVFSSLVLHRYNPDAARDRHPAPLSVRHRRRAALDRRRTGAPDGSPLPDRSSRATEATCDRRLLGTFAFWVVSFLFAPWHVPVAITLALEVVRRVVVAGPRCGSGRRVLLVRTRRRHARLLRLHLVRSHRDRFVPPAGRERDGRIQIRCPVLRTVRFCGARLPPRSSGHIFADARGPRRLAPAFLSRASPLQLGSPLAGSRSLPLDVVVRLWKNPTLRTRSRGCSSMTTIDQRNLIPLPGMMICREKPIKVTVSGRSCVGFSRNFGELRRTPARYRLDHRALPRLGALALRRDRRQARRRRRPSTPQRRFNLDVRGGSSAGRLPNGIRRSRRDAPRDGAPAGIRRRRRRSIASSRTTGSSWWRSRSSTPPQRRPWDLGTGITCSTTPCS